MGCMGNHVAEFKNIIGLIHIPFPTAPPVASWSPIFFFAFAFALVRATGYNFFCTGAAGGKNGKHLDNDYNGNTADNVVDVVYVVYVTSCGREKTGST